MFKTFQSEIKSADDSSLTLKHWISTESKDDGGDVMMAEGMERRGNIVVDFEHGKDPVKGVEPIAKSLGIDVGYNDKGVKGLIATTQFFPDDEGRRLYQKAKDMYMPNWSIEWEPIQQRPIKGGGTQHMKWKLLAYSLVKLGMNSEATTDSNLKFLLKDEESMTTPTPEKKSLTSKVAARVAYSGMNAAHDEMVNSVFDKCYNTKDEPAAIADSLVNEHADILKCHVKDFVTHSRALENEAKCKSLPEFKAMFAASSPAIPATETKTVQTETVPSTETKSLMFAAPDAPAQIAVDQAAVNAGVESALEGLVKKLTGKK